MHSPEPLTSAGDPGRFLQFVQFVARAAVPLALAAVLGAAHADPRLQALSDAPDPAFARPTAVAGEPPGDYAEALRRWGSAEAIDAWLGAHFRYDAARALALSETARAAAGGRAEVLAPAAFFARPQGVCVDMARFAVETLRTVDPAAGAAYLMIEFAPVEVAGQVLRRHWMATFQRGGAHYFFADSKRPGHLAGPYASVGQFVAEYAAYRGRPVLAHRVLPTFERQLRQASPKSAR